MLLIVKESSGKMTSCEVLGNQYDSVFVADTVTELSSSVNK